MRPNSGSQFGLCLCWLATALGRQTLSETKLDRRATIDPCVQFLRLFNYMRKFAWSLVTFACLLSVNSTHTSQYIWSKSLAYFCIHWLSLDFVMFCTYLYLVVRPHEYKYCCKNAT